MESTMKRNLAWWAGILVFVIAFSGVVFFMTGKPYEVADEFMLTVEAGNAGAAYEMTSSDFRERTSETEFEEYMNVTVYFVGGTHSLPYRSVKEHNSDGYAVFSGEVVSAQGESAPLTLKLVKEEGVWRIFSLSVLPEDVPEDY